VNKVYDVTQRLGPSTSHGSSAVAEILAPSLVGYTFLDCVERSPLGEVWKVRSADHRIQVAYYLRAGEGAGRDWRVERLRLFGHADIPGFEIVEADPGRTVLLTDGYEKTLEERFHEFWAHGHPGIPRAELLGYLRSAAEALDAVYLADGFQHLGLNPRALWLDKGRLRIGGFGLIHLLWLPSGRSATELNGRYCAPELFRGHVSRRCDQYSLALIFAEMLVGVHPEENPVGKRRKQARSRKLDLTLLSTADQEVLARALHRQATQRFTTCAALVQALEEAPVAPLIDRTQLPAALPPIIPADPAGQAVPALALPSTTLHQFIVELVALAAGPTQLAASESVRYRLEPGRSLEHHCAVQLFPGAIALKLEGFRQQWHAQGTQTEPGHFCFSVSFPPDFWQRLTGQRLGLEIEIQLVAGPRTSSRRTEVAVVIRPFGCNRAQATRLLEETGPAMLESIRDYLQACPEQRGQDRLTITQPIRVSPVLADMQLARPIDCVGKDVSTRGIGFFLPHPPSTTQVYINVPESPQVASVAGLAQIVRGQPCGDGWYEVGAFFAGDGLGKK